MIRICNFYKYVNKFVLIPFELSSRCKSTCIPMAYVAEGVFINKNK